MIAAMTVGAGGDAAMTASAAAAGAGMSGGVTQGLVADQVAIGGAIGSATNATLTTLPGGLNASSAARRSHREQQSLRVMSWQGGTSVASGSWRKVDPRH